MLTSDAQICTLALLKLGEKQPVDDLDANTTAAKTCKALYEIARDACLELRPWPFATRHALLSLLEDHTATAVTSRGQYQYVYALPADCLVPRYIYANLRNPAPEDMPPFEIEDDGSGSGLVLLTDQKEAELVYTRRLTEVVKMTPLFQEALAWKLAYELTMAIPVKSALGLQMQKGFMQALDMAAASAFKHMTPSTKPRPSAVRAR